MYRELEIIMGYRELQFCNTNSHLPPKGVKNLNFYIQFLKQTSNSLGAKTPHYVQTSLWSTPTPSSADISAPCLSLTSNVKAINFRVPTVIWCEKCSHVFSSYQMIQRHIQEDLNIQCLKCGKHLDTPAENTRVQGMYCALGGFNTVDIYSVHTSASLFYHHNQYFSCFFSVSSCECQNGK
jgi:hypothetical protein